MSERGFRDVLGLFATGVAVITTVAKDGVLVGTTVSSFNSVSLSPPLILFSIARAAFGFSTWLEAKHYAVNILREDQSELSTRFARGGTDKWQGITPGTGVGSTVVLPDSLASLECESYAQYDGGDHVIIVGRVISFASSVAPRPRPLLFFPGRYRQLDAEHEITTPPGVDHLLHGW